MENKPLKMNSKVSSELLNVFDKTVGILRDCELNEAFNRIEIQVKEYEETKQPCDLTYLRDLCNQFDDKLTAVCKAKSDILERMGGATSDGKDSVDKKETTGSTHIGFHG